MHPYQKVKGCEGGMWKSTHRAVLDDLSRDIGLILEIFKTWIKSTNIEEIQADQVQYPGVKEKSFQMLMVWFDRGESVTFSELSRSLKDLGNDKLAKKYCSDF